MTQLEHGAIICSMSSPKRYRIFHVSPGLVRYTDESGEEHLVLVRKEVLDRMNPTFKGKPVFNETHKIIDADTAFDFSSGELAEMADGVVSDVGYDEETNRYWVDAMIWDEQSQQNIEEKGYGASNAYIPESGPGGTYNNMQYDEEVTGGEYHHLALVSNPRYSDTQIIQNSNSGGIMKLKLNFGKDKPKKNQADPKPEEKPDEEVEEMEVNESAVVETDDGEQVAVSELVENYRKMKEAMSENGATVNMDDTMEVDGEEVSIREMYEALKSKKNAEDPTDEPLEPSVKQNSKGKEESGKNKPNENFRTIQNAAGKTEGREKPKVATERKRLVQGKARYGSVIETKGAES